MLYHTKRRRESKRVAWPQSAQTYCNRAVLGKYHSPTSVGRWTMGLKCDIRQADVANSHASNDSRQKKKKNCAKDQRTGGLTPAARLRQLQRRSAQKRN